MSALQQDTAGQIVNPFAGRDVNWLLDFRAETRGNHPFLVWEPFEGERQVWTYRQFRERVLRVAAGLHKRGIKPGDYACSCISTIRRSSNSCGLRAPGSGPSSSRPTRARRAPSSEYFADNCNAVAAVTQPELAETGRAQRAKRLKWLAVTEHLVDGGEPACQSAPSKGERILDASTAIRPTSRARARSMAARLGAIHLGHHVAAQGRAVDARQCALGRARVRHRTRTSTRTTSISS